MTAKIAVQSSEAEETGSAPYLRKLRCPHCFATELSISKQAAVITCSNCSARYPLITAGNGVIPFLFGQLDTAVQGWSARLNGYLLKNNQHIDVLKKSLDDKKTSKLTRQRVKKMMQARVQLAEQLISHLQFFYDHSTSVDLNSNVQVAQNQGVDSYINNIFRDWCWENGENEQLIQAVADVLPAEFTNAGDVLTMGSGAARFSVDFHFRWHANYSVLLDINPLLSQVAKSIIDGQTVSLYEFPIAPLSVDDYAVLQQCTWPKTLDAPRPGQFDFILGDAGNVPFEEKSFDTVLTPWLIDIIPMDLRDFIPHVNRVLKSGGVWVNTGSLAFFHNNESWNYSQSEVTDLLNKYGFDVETSQRTEIQYLHSPHSAHGRRENVFSFCARKKFDSVAPKPHAYLPNWLCDEDMSIPRLNELLAESSKHLLQAQVLSAVDGVRSVRDIGMLLAEQYEMSEQSATAAVRKILMDNYKEFLV